MTQGIALEEFLKSIANGGDGTPKKRMSADAVHEHAVSVLNSLRGLPKGDKRRVLKRAEKLLDS